ncbi:hypothetical protein [Floridanema evergladense]|uniref:Uncharacterized protein n=1 Tax=Floridaenema evergladense BLCC-F167 TaxID=3153639 RepID=A0ABV4WGP6_9CYAN
MSFDEQNLEAFIELLNDKRSSLFSAKDRAELAQLIKPLPDDIEKLSVAIAAWYEKHPKILDAQLAQLSNQSSSGASSDRLPGTKFANIKTPDYNLNKKVLQNAIQQSSATNSSPPSPASK